MSPHQDSLKRAPSTLILYQPWGGALHFHSFFSFPFLGKIASNSNCDLESPLGFLVEKKEKLIWVILVWKERLFLIWKKRLFLIKEVMN